MIDATVVCRCGAVAPIISVGRAIGGRQPCGQGRDELTDGLGGGIGLGSGSHEARSDDHAVGAGLGRLGGLIGARDPEPERDGHLGRGLGTRDHLCEALAERPALARRPDDRHRVEEPLGTGADRRQPLGGRRRGGQRHERDAAPLTGLPHLGRLPVR
jgi:hypothetical protein